MIKKYFLTSLISIFTVFFSIPTLAQRRIDLNERWGFITPCVTTRDEIKKILGSPSQEDEKQFSQTFTSKIEEITVFYDKENSVELCGRELDSNIVTKFTVFLRDEIKLSELNVNLADYKSTDTGHGIRRYYNKDKAVEIFTSQLEGFVEQTFQINFNIHIKEIDENREPLNFEELLAELDPEKEVKELSQDKELHQEIDSMMIGLNNDPESKAFIISYGTAKEVAKREAKILKFIKYRKYPISRIGFRKAIRSGKIKTAFILLPRPFTM